MVSYLCTFLFFWAKLHEFTFTARTNEIRKHFTEAMTMEETFTTLIQMSSLLTNERLSEALSDWFQEKYTFTHWAYVDEVSKGDSFVSEVIRIRIHGVNVNSKPNSVQIILKTIPKNVVRRLTCRSHDFFRNEINFYKNILPEMMDFQSRRNVKNPFTKFAKLFCAYADGTHDVIGLEDQSIFHFGKSVRQEGLDIEHCKIVFSLFAQLHALSFAMRDQEPKAFKELSKLVSEVYYDERYKEWYVKFWNRLSEIAIDAVEKEYPDTIYVEKIKQFAVPERFDDLIVAATKTTENGVICHGDAWAPNFLYKYVDGHPVDAIMIDFQMLRFGSPVLDLSLMLYACTDLELRDKHFEELLHVYHDTLFNQIKDLGSDPEKLYPWSIFMKEVKKYSYFGLGYSMDTIPFAVLDAEDTIDMELEGDQAVNLIEVWKIPNFKTKEGRLRLANNIKHCVDKGFI